MHYRYIEEIRRGCLYRCYLKEERSGFHPDQLKKMVFARKFSYVSPLKMHEIKGERRMSVNRDAQVIKNGERKAKIQCPTCGNCSTLQERYANQLRRYSVLLIKVLLS